MLTPRRRLPRTTAEIAGQLPEDVFQTRVIAWARNNGWKVAHFRRVRVQRADGSIHYETPVAADGKGWPDLVLARGAHVLYRELKTDTGRPSAEQREWIAMLDAAGQDVAIWRPRDWDAIEVILSRANEHKPSRLSLAEAVCALVRPLADELHDGARAVSIEPLRAAWRAWRHLSGEKDAT